MKLKNKKGALASAGALASIRCSWMSWSSGTAGVGDDRRRHPSEGQV